MVDPDDAMMAIFSSSGNISGGAREVLGQVSAEALHLFFEDVSASFHHVVRGERGHRLESEELEIEVHRQPEVVDAPAFEEARRSKARFKEEARGGGETLGLEEAADLSPPEPCLSNHVTPFLGRSTASD